MDENDIIAAWGDAAPWVLRMTVTQHSAGSRHVEFSVMALGHAGATRAFQIPASKIPAIIAALTQFGIETENA